MQPRCQARQTIDHIRQRLSGQGSYHEHDARGKRYERILASAVSSHDVPFRLLFRVSRCPLRLHIGSHQIRYPSKPFCMVSVFLLPS